MQYCFDTLFKFPKLFVNSKIRTNNYYEMRVSFIENKNMPLTDIILFKKPNIKYKYLYSVRIFSDRLLKSCHVDKTLN